MQSEPDYEKYSYDDLIDVYEHIDRNLYPDRFKKIAILLDKSVVEKELPSVTNEFDKPASKPNKIEDTSEIAELKKMQRIDGFFDSLSESGSEYHSASFGGGGCSGDDDGGGGGD